METALVTTQIRWSVDQAYCEIAFKVKHLMIAHLKGPVDMTMRLEQSERFKGV